MGDSPRVIEVKASVLAANDREADSLRDELRRKGTFLVNLMSSPGSGKTTTLARTVENLEDRLAVAVLEADIDSDVDARTMLGLGIPAVQLHTGGMCHLDAGMTRQGLEALDSEVEGGIETVDLVFLENVGNLVCPAEFDTGACANIAIVSVPEGDDKPLKYPLMFQVSEAVLVNKTDVAEAFDFSLERFSSNVARRNPRARIFPMSAKTGEGVGDWCDWLESRVDAWRAGR